MKQSTETTDISAALFVSLQRLNGAISQYRAYYTMAGFIAKAHYTASHVAKQECYTAEQWLSDFFANKTGLIPSFLDMNQCVPQSPEAAAKMLSAFADGLQQLPSLTPRGGGQSLDLFNALRADIEGASKSRKLRGTSPIFLTQKQKEIGLELIDATEQAYNQTTSLLQTLIAAYQSA